MTLMSRRPPVLLVPLLAALLLGCAADDADGEAAGATAPAPTAAAAAATTTSAPEAIEALRIVVTNDDGIGHPGIDVLARRLAELPDTEVSVVAPAEDRTGGSDQTSPGPVSHVAARTASGMEGIAVDGFPADSVLVALGELDLQPHLVASGINVGQNIGPLAAISGTVGAARTAVRSGVPAVAVSAALEFDEAQFAAAADLAAEWVTEHRAALLDGTLRTGTVASFNVPACSPDHMGEVVEVPLAPAFPEGVNPFESTCDQGIAEPATDYEAIAAGYPALTAVPPDL